MRRLKLKISAISVELVLADNQFIGVEFDDIGDDVAGAGFAVQLRVVLVMFVLLTLLLLLLLIL